MIRIGKVSSVNASKAAVRVVFSAADEKVSNWLQILFLPGQYCIPHVGETVVCIFKDKSGFVLGTYYGDGDITPGTEQHQGVWFEDGSHVYYDHSSGKLHIKAASGVHIDGDLTVSGSITRAGVVI